MWCKTPSELGIKRISREQYLSECEKGLKILSIASCGSGNIVNPKNDDVMMVSMCKPGEDTPRVSYTKLGNEYIFTKGPPWSVTPLVPIEVGWPKWKEQMYAEWQKQTGGSREDYDNFLREQKEKCQCGCE